MTNKEIIENLATKENFHKIVEICLKEGIEIPRKGMPDLNIYRHIDGNKLRWSEIFEDGIWSFKTNDGKEYQTLNDFFTHFENIIEFTKLNKIETVVFKVSPNIVGKNETNWYRDASSPHYEISYNCHSFSGPALIVYRFNNGVRYIHKSEYYINGMLTDEKTWRMFSRENKLSRLCGIDLKKEREEKEKKEKESKEKYWTKFTYSNKDDYQHYA